MPVINCEEILPSSLNSPHLSLPNILNGIVLLYSNFIPCFVSSRKYGVIGLSGSRP